MISLNRYSSYFLLFLQYGEGIGIHMGIGLFGMFFPTTFLRQSCPWFSESDVMEHPVLHMMTRMFCTVMFLLGMIEYSLVRYCTASSTVGDNRSTKEYILRIFVSCVAIADFIHTSSYLNYHLSYGLSLEPSAIVYMYGSSGLFAVRIIFLWSNYQNKKKTQRKK